MSLLDIVQKHGGRLTLDGVEFTGRKKGRAPAPDECVLAFPSLETFTAGMQETITTGQCNPTTAEKRENASALASRLTPAKDNPDFWGRAELAELAPEKLPFYSDLEPVETARERIVSSASFQEFEASLVNLGMKRRRFFSEHDGEYIEDRALEIAPFLATRRQSAPIRVVEITARFSVAWYVTPDKITEFGATIAALVSILEGAGILCGLTLEYYKTQFCEQRSGGRDLRIRVPVKRPDEYLPPASIAAALSSNCYRRLGLAASPLVADIIGREVSGGFGKVHETAIAWAPETGTLTIPSSNFFSSPTGETDRIIQALKSALGLAPITGAA